MKKKKDNNLEKNSFYFEDYNHNPSHESKKNKIGISEDRIYLLFFVFFCLIFIFALKIVITSLQDSVFKKQVQNYSIFNSMRNDIVDRNGELIARNIRVYHAAIRPSLIKDKKQFLIKLKLLYPKIDTEAFRQNLDKNKYFYLKKNITEEERAKLWSLGEKGLLFEASQTRVYPQKNLFSHVIGQIDLDNNGISGVERYFDKKLKSEQTEPLKLSLDVTFANLLSSQLE